MIGSTAEGNKSTVVNRDIALTDGVPT
jgi:hypothetical protein